MKRITANYCATICVEIYVSCNVLSVLICEYFTARSLISLVTLFIFMHFKQQENYAVDIVMNGAFNEASANHRSNDESLGERNGVEGGLVGMWNKQAVSVLFERNRLALRANVLTSSNSSWWTTNSESEWVSNGLNCFACSAK